MRAVWIALLLGLSSLAVDAHHSIASIYDSSQPVTVEGTVKQFHFISPHPFVTVEVKDARGASHVWQMEMDNRWELADIGVTSSTLRPVDRVVVTGSRARSQSNNLYVRRLDRPADGFRYEQVGSSPRIR
jgi:hypothetical protein